MLGTAIRTFANTWLNPVINPEFARTDSVKLAPGTYVAGRVLGNSNFAAVATNAVQTFTATGTPNAGSVRLAWSIDQQYVSASIAFNSSAGAAQTVLEAIFGVGNVVVTGGAWPGTPLVVTFVGKAAAQRLPLGTLYSNAFGGGTAPTVTVANTTKGKAAGGEWINYDDSGNEGEEVARMLLKFPVNVDFFGVHLTGGTSMPTKGFSAPAYYRGYFRTNDLTGLDANGIVELGKVVRGNGSNLTNAGTILRIA